MQSVAATTGRGIVERQAQVISPAEPLEGAAGEKSVRADRLKSARRRCLDFEQPMQCFQSEVDHRLIVHATATQNHGVRKFGVCVTNDFLEPLPIAIGGVRIALHQLSGEGLTNLASSTVPTEALQIFINADQCKSPGAR